MIEATATSIGAGIVLGGFVMGAIGLAAGWSQENFERRVLRDGYMGGVVGSMALIVDLFFRYAF